MSELGDSRRLLEQAIELYSAYYRRVGGSLADDPYCGPCIAFSSGSSSLGMRLRAEPFDLDEDVFRAFAELSRPLHEVRSVADEQELLELFPNRVLALIERRQGPPERWPDGRRWIDRRIEAEPIGARAAGPAGVGS